MQKEKRKWLAVHLALDEALLALTKGETAQTRKILERLLVFSEKNWPLEKERTPLLWLDETIIDADET